jgi:hypothetical protein
MQIGKTEVAALMLPYTLVLLVLLVLLVIWTPILGTWTVLGSPLGPSLSIPAGVLAALAGMCIGSPCRTSLPVWRWASIRGCC